VSPEARGTTYSATRIGVEAGRRRQRGGSSHRKPGLLSDARAAARDDGAGVETAGALELEAG
jgi:hypothetical protein